MKELHLTKKDFKLEWYSGTGAGGQHRNKHQNCCRITHIASGLVEHGTESRSRVDNQRTAFERLAKRVIEWYDIPEIREISNERIRTYHAERNEVIDHASGRIESYKDVVENGNLGGMIESRMKVLR